MSEAIKFVNSALGELVAQRDAGVGMTGDMPVIRIVCRSPSREATMFQRLLRIIRMKLYFRKRR